MKREPTQQASSPVVSSAVKVAPTENAILTARAIDRPMRPLFPDDYRNDVVLSNMVFAADP